MTDGRLPAANNCIRARTDRACAAMCEDAWNCISAWDGIRRNREKGMVLGGYMYMNRAPESIEKQTNDTRRDIGTTTPIGMRVLYKSVATFTIARQ